MKRQTITNEQKAQIVIQPFIKKREIMLVLNCTAKMAEYIFESILLLMKQKNYRIIDYSYVPTKLFLAYCDLAVEDFVRAATIEKKLTGDDDVA